jgi:hypothetical protein
MSFSEDEIDFSFEDLKKIPNFLLKKNSKSLFLTGNFLTSFEL